MLQAKGPQTAGEISETDNANAEETAPAPEATVASLPAGQAELPATMAQPQPAPVAISPKPTPVKRAEESTVSLPKPETIPLDNVQAYRVYDAHHKSATQKTFTSTPNGIRSALAYYRSVSGRAASRTIIEAEISDGSWVSVLPSTFKNYAQKTLS
jgi:hypothetical protein